jgi:hypothetical protein
MDLIILNDGMYHLIPVTKEMLKEIALVAQVSCFDICEIIRLKWTTYSKLLNAYVMNDGSGDFYGCICN